VPSWCAPAASEALAAAEVRLTSQEVELGPTLSLASLAGIDPRQAIRGQNRCGFDQNDVQPGRQFG
jgi:hypothetical protein